MKSKKIIAVVGGSFLLAAAFLLILCIKFVNMKESSPTGKYAGKTEKVEQTTTDKKEQKKPDWVEEKISGMTLEEKAGMCSGADFWHLKGIERLGIPQVMVTDGPHGIRKQAEEADHLGINESEKAICFPAGCATASSFDRELIRKQGELLGQECQAMDVSTHIKSDKVKILTGEQELVSVDNGARIDYTKSDEKLVLGDREVAMPDDAAYHQLVVPNAKHASLVL